MATFAVRPIHPVKRLDGYTFVDKPLATGQTFKDGAPVLFNVSNEIAEAGTTPVADIVGFALAAVADYAWKADTFLRVKPSVPVATADQEFRGTLKGTFAAADVGAVFGLTRQSSGTWTLDRAKTATSGGDGANEAACRVVAADDGVAVGDIDAPVRFVVLPAARKVIS